MNSEFKRKLVHISMGFAALLLCLLTWRQAFLLAVAAFLYNLLVLPRLGGQAIYRAAERKKGYAVGILSYPISIAALILIFHNRLAFAAAVWAILAFGDGMATVIGISTGRHKISWNPAKSWEGVFAFIVFGGFAASFLLWWTDPGSVPEAGFAKYWFFLGLGILPAIACAFTETLNITLDDNISVPLVGAASISILSMTQPDLLAELFQNHETVIVAIVLNLALGLAAWFARTVDLSGFLGGVFIGSLIFISLGWRGFAILFLFFVLASLATKAGYQRKEAKGIAQDKGGRREIGHATANCLAALIFAFLAASTGHHSLFALAFVAAFATALSDTVGSELGQLYGKTPILLTSLKRVPAGTEGAVSLEGTILSILASLLVGGAGWALGIIPAAGIAFVAVAALLATFVESVLGATIEKRGWIDNEINNFLNTAVGGCLCIVMATLFN